MNVVEKYTDKKIESTQTIDTRGRGRTIQDALELVPKITHLNTDAVIMHKEETLKGANASQSTLVRFLYRHALVSAIVAYAGASVLFGCFIATAAHHKVLSAFFFSLMFVPLFGVFLIMYASDGMMRWHRTPLKNYTGYIPSRARETALTVLSRTEGVSMYVDSLGADPYLVAEREEFGEVVEEVYLDFWDNPPKVPTQDLRRVRLY